MIIIILLLAALLRVPSLFEPYWYGDEGIYLVLGQALRKGLVWYREMHDNKPPLLYLLAAGTGDVMGMRGVTLVWNMINIVLVWFLAKKLFKSSWVIALTTSLFALLTTLPELEGNIANGEIFMIMPVCAGMLLLLGKRPKSVILKMLLSGLLFSIGFLFKVPVAFDLIAVGIFVLFFQKKVSLLTRIKGGLSLGFGFVVPILITIAYYFFVGAGEEYLNAAFFQNVGYLSSWRTGQVVGSSLNTQSGLLIRGIIALLVTIFVWWLSRSAKSEKRLVIVWLVWALFGALLSERPYPHYLLQAVPPAVLTLGVMIETKKKEVALAAFLVLGLSLFSIYRYQFYFYSSTKYYSRFIEMMTGKMSKVDYRNDFDWRVRRTYELSKYLKERTTDSDRIFVWGDEPFVYVGSERLPVGRYTTAYHITDFKGHEETMEAIKKEEPKFIVMMTSEKRDFKELVLYVDMYYVEILRIEDAVVYRRMGINGINSVLE